MQLSLWHILTLNAHRCDDWYHSSICRYQLKRLTTIDSRVEAEVLVHAASSHSRRLGGVWKPRRRIGPDVAGVAIVGRAIASAIVVGEEIVNHVL